MIKDKIDKDRETRLAKTGQLFEKEIKTKLNIWSTIILPTILIISLIFTFFIALD